MKNVRMIDVRAPRFAVWATSAVLAVALLAGSGVLVAAQAVVFTVGAVATGLALVAALLNAATGFCLGCELYLITRRALPART
jgi:zinc transporter ZupT